MSRLRSRLAQGCNGKEVSIWFQCLENSTCWHYSKVALRPKLKELQTQYDARMASQKLAANIHASIKLHQSLRDPTKMKEVATNATFGIQPAEDFVCKLVLQIHDELLFEVKVDCISDVMVNAR